MPHGFGEDVREQGVVGVAKDQVEHPLLPFGRVVWSELYTTATQSAVLSQVVVHCENVGYAAPGVVLKLLQYA